MKCSLCKREMFPEQTGEPWINFKKKSPVCCGCYLDIIPIIYEMSGMGDGGLIQVIFKACLSSTHNRKRRIPIKNYNKVFQKLLCRYKFKCVECKTSKNLTIDHIQPFSKGGLDEISNLQILCKSCNSKKGNR